MRVVRTLTKMLHHRKREIVGALVGLACGWVLFSSQPSSADDHVQDSVQKIQKTAEESEEDDAEAFVAELADEFRMDPHIVTLVHDLSMEYVDPSKQEWRLLRTPEALSYLMLCVIHAESRGDPSAVGDHGRARGLTQIWVSTAAKYGKVTPEQLLDPETNLRFSFQHFHHLLRKYKGNFPLALYAWNRGITKVNRLLRNGQPLANGYARKVYNAAQIRDEEMTQMGN